MWEWETKVKGKCMKDLERGVKKDEGQERVKIEGDEYIFKERGFKER